MENKIVTKETMNKKEILLNTILANSKMVLTEMSKNIDNWSEFECYGGLNDINYNYDVWLHRFQWSENYIDPDIKNTIKDLKCKFYTCLYEDKHFTVYFTDEKIMAWSNCKFYN